MKSGAYYEDSEKKKLLRSKGICTTNLVDLSPNTSATFCEKSGSCYEDSEHDLFAKNTGF